METVPATCTPGALSFPAATSTSWNTTPSSLGSQRLTCTLTGPFAADSTISREFLARVLPVFQGGEALTASATVTAHVPDTDQGAGNGAEVLYTTTPDTVTDTVSAARKYDVQVMGTKGDPDAAGYIQHEGRYTSCLVAGPTGGPTYNQACVNMNMPVQIAVPDGGRGSVPVDPSVPFTFKLDLTLDAMYGAGATQYIADTKGITLDQVAMYYGARLNTCAQANPYDAPRTTAGSPPNYQNSVRNSGTTTCQFNGATAARTPAAYGQVLDITVTGMDSTVFTYPELNGNGCCRSSRRMRSATRSTPTSTPPV